MRADELERGGIGHVLGRPRLGLAGHGLAVEEDGHALRRRGNLGATAVASVPSTTVVTFGPRPWPPSSTRRTWLRWWFVVVQLCRKRKGSDAGQRLGALLPLGQTPQRRLWPKAGGGYRPNPSYPPNGPNA